VTGERHPEAGDDRVERLLDRFEHLLDHVERLLPPAPPREELDAAVAFRWRKLRGRPYLEAVRRPHRLQLADLHCIDRQKDELTRNTRQFVAARPANNVLLSGSRGTGKSSLIKALLTDFSSQGLRLIEVDKSDLVDLPEIVDRLQDRAERYILFCDDLSFEADDASYKSLKAILDGSVVAAPENVLIYATSNRRHLLPEYMEENLDARVVGTEIHHGEAVEEKISLSDRFGLWLSFYPFNQEQYLEIVGQWLSSLGIAESNFAETEKVALQWALTRGSRSGRVAWQFAKDWAGRRA
jgi:predicted AAA+ superfamily ATPase